MILAHIPRLTGRVSHDFASPSEKRWRVNDVVAEMIGLDPADAQVREMLAYYRLMFASEPNVNGRNRGILEALGEVGDRAQV